MRILRSKLLITLALLCIVTAGTAAASSSTIQLRYASADGGTAYSGGSDPNAGEPDVGQGAPQPSRYSVTQTRREGATVQPGSRQVRAFALSLRWARVIWMARYLGLTP